LDLCQTYSEFYGHATHFEHPSPAPLSELSEDYFPDVLNTEYNPLLVPTVRGETIEALHDRVAYVLNRLIEGADQDPVGPKAILICTHAACIIATGRVLTGRMPEKVEEEDFACYTAGLSVYRRNSTQSAEQVDGWSSTAPEEVPKVQWQGKGLAGGWVCEKNSDCSFLSGGAERGWRFFGDESFIWNPNAFNDVLLDKNGKGSRL
jgi:transcription factor C subunit 7